MKKIEEAQDYNGNIIVHVPIGLATDIIERLSISETRARLEDLIEQAMEDNTNKTKSTRPLSTSDGQSLAEVFHPSVFIRDQMKQRGISKDDLVALHNVLTCELPVTPRIANFLSFIFGTTPEVWMNMQRLWDDKIGINKTKENEV